MTGTSTKGAKYMVENENRVGDTPNTRRAALKAAHKDAKRIANAAQAIIRAVEAMQVVDKARRTRATTVEAANAEQYREWRKVHASMADWGDALLDLTWHFCDAPCFAVFRAEDRKLDRATRRDAIEAEVRQMGRGNAAAGEEAQS